MICSRRKQRLPIIGRAIFGTDTWRFAAMLGTFTSVYKFLINALPLFMPTLRFPSNPFFDDDEEAAWHTVQVPIPSPRHRRRSQRLSLSTEAQQVLVRKKTRRWHAALAGFTAGGLAVLFETRGRRITISPADVRPWIARLFQCIYDRQEYHNTLWRCNIIFANVRFRGSPSYHALTFLQ